MFGLGAGELIIIAIVALLALGPDKLPEAAKKIGKGIRDLKRQTRDLQETIEHDTEIGGAVRDFKAALRGEDAPGAKTANPSSAKAKASPTSDDAKSPEPPTPTPDALAVPAPTPDPEPKPDGSDPVSETDAPNDAPDDAPDETPDSSAHG